MTGITLYVSGRSIRNVVVLIHIIFCVSIRCNLMHGYILFVIVNEFKAYRIVFTLPSHRETCKKIAAKVCNHIP